MTETTELITFELSEPMANRLQNVVNGLVQSGLDESTAFDQLIRFAVERAA